MISWLDRSKEKGIYIYIYMCVCVCLCAYIFFLLPEGTLNVPSRKPLNPLSQLLKGGVSIRYTERCDVPFLLGLHLLCVCKFTKAR